MNCSDHAPLDCEEAEMVMSAGSSIPVRVEPVTPSPRMILVVPVPDNFTQAEAAAFKQEIKHSLDIVVRDAVAHIQSARCEVAQ